MEDYIKRYHELYSEMATAKDPKKMMVFGDAEQWVFGMVAEKHPELAEKWLARLESGKWNNYLTQEEAEHIVNSLVERVGENANVRRYEWDYPTMKGAVEAMGGKVSEEPYYNCWALWATMNMLYSDHAYTVSSFIQSSMKPKFFYKMAVDKLKDPDRSHFVREYFDLD